MNILLIGINYHNYTVEIIQELIAQGHTVRYYDIQPGKLWFKVLRKFASDHYRSALDLYHEDIISREKGLNADMVLFIQVHQFSIENMMRLRGCHPSARFVLYNWDAVSNHDYRGYISHFDDVYTFDPEDAVALKLRYLPLFCIPAFQHLRPCDSTGSNVYTVGNIVNPKRYEAIRSFGHYCREQGIGFQTFLSASSHAVTALVKNGYCPLDVSFRSISTKKFIEMIESSSAVFDFANHIQSGYTMRTIENLCAGKKIITNNRRICSESFYSEDRICIFNGLDFSGVKDFLKIPIQQPDLNFCEFHLEGFVNRLVSS